MQNGLKSAMHIWKWERAGSRVHFRCTISCPTWLT